MRGQEEQQPGDRPHRREPDLEEEREPDGRAHEAPRRDLEASRRGQELKRRLKIKFESR